MELVWRRAWMANRGSPQAGAGPVTRPLQPGELGALRHEVGEGDRVLGVVVMVEYGGVELPERNNGRPELRRLELRGGVDHTGRHQAERLMHDLEQSDVRVLTGRDGVELAMDCASFVGGRTDAQTARNLCCDTVPRRGGADL